MSEVKHILGKSLTGALYAAAQEDGVDFGWALRAAVKDWLNFRRHEKEVDGNQTTGARNETTSENPGQSPPRLSSTLGS